MSWTLVFTAQAKKDAKKSSCLCSPQSPESPVCPLGQHRAIRLLRSALQWTEWD